MEDVVLPAEMDVGTVAPNFLGVFGSRCSPVSGTAAGTGGSVWFGSSSPHGATGDGDAHCNLWCTFGRRRGSLPIFLIKEAVLGFFSREDGVLLDV
jgi:hypothetical protein